MALTDPALFNSILFVGAQFKATIYGQKERPSAVNHLKETIRILNERLQDPLQEISDSTISAVASIALIEVSAPHFCSKDTPTYFQQQSTGNQANWRIHIRGIRRMVEMRGGLSAFEGNPTLHDKLCR
jgi:hypothetical protein